MRNKINSLGFRYVSALRRFSVTMLDLVIAAFILQFINYLSNFIVSYDDAPFEVLQKIMLGIEVNEEEHQLFSVYATKIISLQVFELCFFSYLICYMWNKFGATPGKIFFGIIIVDQDTLETPKKMQSFKRLFSTILSTLPLGLGILWSIFDKKSQTFHDKIANTIVIYKKDLESIKEAKKVNLSAE